MPGMRCAVAVCGNSLVKTKKSGRKVSFYQFPKNQELCNIWMQKCGRKDNQWNPSSNRICSEHFGPDDYKRDLQAELLSIPVKKRLKSTAIPSKNLTVNPENALENTPSPVCERRKRLQRRHNQQVVRDILAQDESSEEITIIVETVPCISEDATEAVLPSTSPELTQIEFSSAIAQPEVTLAMRYNEFMEENHELKQLLMVRDETIKEMSKKQKDLERTISNLRLNLKLESASRTRIEKGMRSILSKAQVDLVLGRRKQVRWSSDDICKAFTIRYFSKRCYLYLKNQLKYPLPGISSLQRWAAQLNLRQGVL